MMRLVGFEEAGLETAEEKADVVNSLGRLFDWKKETIDACCFRSGGRFDMMLCSRNAEDDDFGNVADDIRKETSFMLSKATAS
jgi:hypothetical protein